VATRFALFVALALPLAAGIAPASAQNLLVNPNFDTGLSGWQTTLVAPGTTISWDGTRDAEGSLTSGSAKGSWAATTVSGLVPVVSQCVEVTTGASYRVGGKVFIPPGQATSGSAFFIAAPYPTHGCSGPPPPGPFLTTPAVTATGQWTESAATFASFGPSVLVSAYMAPNAAGNFEVNFDDLILEPAASSACSSDATTLCFMDGRFKVTAAFDAGNGNAGQAHAIPVGDSGLFWFFSSTNIEAVVKVLDGCGLGGHYWFFAGGLTNVQVTLLVTDTQTGATRTYHNPLGTPFEPVQDTSAFSCSP
jgi:hypothetical protein